MPVAGERKVGGVKTGLVQFVSSLLPAMFLVCKFQEYKRHQEDQSRRKVTEKELSNLNHKIVSTPSLLMPHFILATRLLFGVPSNAVVTIGMALKVALVSACNQMMIESESGRLFSIVSHLLHLIRILIHLGPC